MPSMNKLSTYRTTVMCTAGRIAVTYVSTLIVDATPDTVTLDSGGWQTVTTKRKMCQAANQFGLGFKVFQEKGEWYVRRLGRNAEGLATWDNGVTLPYHDGMTFPRGTVKMEA